MKKFFLSLIFVFVFFGFFSVKKTWAIPCCTAGIYIPDINQCFNSALPKDLQYSPTNCSTPPNNGVCELDSFSNTYLCNLNITPGPKPSGGSPFDPCKNLADRAECEACTGINSSGTFTACGSGTSCGTWTSLGCIPNDPAALVGYLLKFGTGIAGGIAFLLILFGAGQIVMSGGVPEKIAAGKEIITSAVIGLVFIFVSVLILQIIGVKIIGIPGWT